MDEMFPESPSALPAVLGLLFLLAAGLAIYFYTSETAQIIRDDLQESTGKKVKQRVPWQSGWTRAAWRMFLIDLIVVPAVMGACALGLFLAGLPLLAWGTDSGGLRIAGTSLAILLFLAGAAAVLIGVPAVGVVVILARRACVLDGLGPFAALQCGAGVVKSHPAESAMMGLALFGIGLLWTFILVPVVLVLAILGALLAWFPALFVALAVGRVGGENAGLAAAAAVGLPIFLGVILVPSVLLDSWLEPLFSSSWTRFYRDAK